MSPPAHVLIVDDDDDLRDVMGLWLHSAGHSSAGARDGQVALARLADGPCVDVIVLDLEMPGMDGRTFLAHKARGAHAAIPVVIFSSSPHAGLELLSSVIAVVSKGDGIEALVAAIPGEFHA